MPKTKLRTSSLKLPPPSNRLSIASGRRRHLLDGGPGRTVSLPAERHPDQADRCGIGAARRPPGESRQRIASPTCPAAERRLPAEIRVCRRARREWRGARCASLRVLRVAPRLRTRRPTNLFARRSRQDCLQRHRWQAGRSATRRPRSGWLDEHRFQCGVAPQASAARTSAAQAAAPAASGLPIRGDQRTLPQPGCCPLRRS